MKYLLLLGCSLVVASPAWAQSDLLCPHPDDVVVTCDPPAPPNRNSPVPVKTITTDELYEEVNLRDAHEITVTATGSRSLVEQTGQSISMLTADDLAGVQGPDLTRALERLPGVSLARSGGLGSQTSLFVRGANSEQLLVTIDGIRVEDTAAPSGGFDLGTLLSGGIGRIELLRGSNSLLGVRLQSAACSHSKPIRATARAPVWNMARTICSMPMPGWGLTAIAIRWDWRAAIPAPTVFRPLRAALKSIRSANGIWAGAARSI